MTNATRVALVVDVDVYFRMAVSALLTRELGFSDVIEVHTFGDAEDYLQDHSEISVTILDLLTPGMRAAAGIRTLRTRFPQTKVVITSVSSSRRDILSALESGAHGYLPKNLNIGELTASLRLVLDGGIYVPPSLADLTPQIPEAVIRLPELRDFSDVTARSPLTPRQLDVLELLAQGKPNKEIASALKLGEGTVKIHLAAIFRYFGVNNRAAAAVASARPHPGRGLSHLSRTPHEAASIHAK